jgi:uncharacterized protein YqhQ
MAKKYYYGGQAVMEGVMMRGQKAMVTAVRRPNGGVTLDAQLLSSFYAGRWRRMPLVRGVIVLIETLVLGIRSLLYSANVSLEEEEAKISGWYVWLMLLFSVAVAVVLFFLAPLFLANLIKPYITSAFVFSLVEGLIRVAIFVLYLWLISLMPDIRRYFAYHGAEHKSINAYEAGVPLEVEAVKRYGTAHRRCGTSFLFVVLVIAIIVFSLVGLPALWLLVLSRIVLVPVIAALGYEVIYFTAGHADNPIVRAVSAPGLWLQKMTTREPTDDQLEVALVALGKALEIDQAEEVTQPQPSASASVSS